MKKFLLSVLWVLLVQVAYAQDVIVKVNGDELKAKVLEINLAAILYEIPDSVQVVDSVNTNVLSIARSEVFMVRFANGTKEVFQENLPTASDSVNLAGTPDEMYQLGQHEARQYYTGNGALWGSLASLTIGPLGLIGPLIIGSTKPQAYKHPVSSQHLLQNPDFVRGYEKQAHKRKVGKTFLGTGIGATLLITAIIISVSSVQ